VEQVQAEATTAEEPETPVVPHTVEDVDQLKKEVEALREQLAALEKKNVQDAATKATEEADAAKESAARAAAMHNAAIAMEAMTANLPGSGNAGKLKEELAPVNEPSPVPAHVPAKVEEAALMPAAKDKSESARGMVSMQLPVWKTEKSPEEQLLEEEAAREAKTEAKAPEQLHEPAEELLPKPALDFSQAPKNGAQAKSGGIKAIRAPQLSKGRVIGLSAVLAVTLVGGSWYGKWWELLPFGKKTTAATVVKKPNPIRPGAAAGNAKAGATTTPNAVTAGTNAGAAAVGADAAKDDKNVAAGTSAEAGAAKPEGAEAATAPAAAPVPEKKLGLRERLFGKKSVTKEEEAPSAAAAETVAGSDAPLQPAKLLKAANPVYPPDAMRSYITGDVKAEVVVKASGRVGDVKVISGPKALREAAVEALRQYEYAPATQGGKAVESKAEAVVKFWFNP
jgi:TonB family protein